MSGAHYGRVAVLRVYAVSGWQVAGAVVITEGCGFILQFVCVKCEVALIRHLSRSRCRLVV